MTTKSKVIFDNIVRAVLGVSLAVNGFFIQRTVTSLEKIEERTRVNEVDIAVEKTTNNIQNVLIAELRRKK